MIVKRVFSPLFSLILIFGLFLTSGCTTGDTFTYGPPADWQADGTKWWKAGQDTSGLFPDLETLETMDVAGASDVYLSNAALNSSNDARDQFARAVKRGLIQMYRNEPAIVDSLFEQFLTPKVADVQFTNDPVKDVEKFKKDAVNLLRRHFREPRTKLELGTDVMVVYPDSLREQGIEGAVKMQVYLDEEGNPLTVELIDSVHPVLNQLAMIATTEMRWLPAYVEYNRDWKPIPSWTRFRITFRTS